MIGKGAYGSVFLIRDKESKEQLAMKIIKISDEEKIKQIDNEINITKVLFFLII